MMIMHQSEKEGVKEDTIGSIKRMWSHSTALDNMDININLLTAHPSFEASESRVAATYFSSVRQTD